MKFLDIFSGIGGFRIGMEMAGHKCVGHIEWDKFAQKSYMAMHDVKESEFIGRDIKKVRADELPRADCWCFGFPCQDISIAGKQEGFAGHRSSLFFAVTRLIRDLEEENRPSILFIENVKNLLSINRGGDFLKLLIELDEIGYDAEWQVLNSKDFGVPQSRERVFVVGHFRGRGGRKVFPITIQDTKNNIEVVGFLRESKIKDRVRILSVNGIGQALRATDYKDPVKIYDDGKVRRLTPKEYFRQQGISDKYFYRAAKVNSDSQLYKQAGNMVTVNVIYEIAKRL